MPVTWGYVGSAVGRRPVTVDDLDIVLDSWRLGRVGVSHRTVVVQGDIALWRPASRPVPTTTVSAAMGAREEQPVPVDGRRLNEEPLVKRDASRRGLRPNTLRHGLERATRTLPRPRRRAARGR